MSTARSTPLRPGLIFEIARDAGLDIPDHGDKRPIRCPFHDDRRPSAFVSVLNVFYCSVCTPEGGWSAKRFAEALRSPWSPPREDNAATGQFTPKQAEVVWHLARQRALDDNRAEQDRAVYAYLARRHLMESWELRLFGVIARGTPLPEPVAWWPEAGYRLVVPVYDQRGQLTNVQARSITGREPKVVFPKDSVARGTLFANNLGLALLRGWEKVDSRVMLGEGLTDFLALSIVSPVPVLAVPGTGATARSIGPWARGKHVILALDNDRAGEQAISAAAAEAREHGAERVSQITWPASSQDACQALERIGDVPFADFVERCVRCG